ncbi:major facilitator superfamily domain-containing protein [Mycena galericulata]|nr:major facilitator superfamily domain-containing protein [Mycena galericulata]
MHPKQAASSNSDLVPLTALSSNASPSSSPTPPLKSEPKSRAFWMCLVAIMVSVFLSALDLTAVGTALPTISAALHDRRGNYIWVGAAYAMSSTAFIPLSGNLADVFGRKIVMLVSISFFALGSALAGSAHDMSMLIAARAIQGIGGGGILTLTEILTADLVPLSERGLYQGVLAVVWAAAAFSGPSIGGALSSRGTHTWRWLFFLNLPLSAIAFVLVSFFLSVHRPAGSVRDKLWRVDWVGNGIIIFGTGLATIGLTGGGVRYSWASAQVLGPLIGGLSLIVVFGVYEAKVPVSPTVPQDVVGNRTSVSGLIGTAMHGIISISMIYYIPVFFQACFDANPIRSAIDFLPGSVATVPFAAIATILISVFKKYRLINWVAWVFLVIGLGLVSTIRQDSPTAKWVGYQIITSVGIGVLFDAPVFPILAPLPTNRAASALALFSFTRSFAQTWGITISSSILQNGLKKRLPAAFVAQFPARTEIAIAAIPAIHRLQGPLRTQVEIAFAESMAVIWQVMIGFAGIGFLSSLMMAEIPMSTEVDEAYALKDKKKVGDIEMMRYVESREIR